MADRAHEWTDEQIDRLNRRLAREYSQAAMEMRTKLNSYLEDYEYANQSWKDAVRSGDATREEYRKWLASQASKRRYVVDMTDMLANDAFNTSQRAFEIINDTIPQVYAENANWAAYSIENGIGRDTGGFALYDRDTVRRLMSMEDDDQVIHEVVPYGPILPEKQRLNLQSLRVEPEKVKYVRWNRQKFTSAITQSILQGESIPNAAKRLAGVLNMDKNMATRAARTAMTSAENAGRVDSYERAKRIGIDLEQEWMATLDERTRASHRLLDGEHVPVGQKFSNGLRFPADPSGDGSEIWNCRCTLAAWLPNIENEDNQRWSRLPKGMTYDEWKHGKKVEKDRKEAAGIVDGKDILATWKRREGEFDFEIEDIINAQGFDGKPRIVDADEFDQAVKAANGGDGLVMQRVYSAPDQATLDAYRESLYDGKWYVDCSHGNDTYGKGMYTASSKSTSVTQQMADEIAPYRREFSYTETMTLDPSARVIGYNEVVSAKNDASVLERAIVGGDDISDTERAIVRREVLREFSDEDRTLAKAAEREWDFDDYMDVIKTYSQREREFRELGTSEVAALLGYDAVEVPGLNYTVVLNRTKLIIRRP